MEAAVEIGSLISRRPEIRGGRPCIAGTGVSVRRLVIFYNMGMTVEEIAQDWPQLSLAQVQAAIAYYHANKVEIDADIEAEDREADRLAELHRADR